MWDLIRNNISTIVVAAILIAVVIVVARKAIKDKKEGKCSCGSNCGGCPNSKNCKM